MRQDQAAAERGGALVFAFPDHIEDRAGSQVELAQRFELGCVRGQLPEQFGRVRGRHAAHHVPGNIERSVIHGIISSFIRADPFRTEAFPFLLPTVREADNRNKVRLS